VTNRRSLVALVLAATLAAPFAGPVRAAPPVAQPFDGAAYDAALASGRPMLVEITADWCPTCRKQKQVFADLLQDPRYEDLLILSVDFDREKAVVQSLGAQTQSTLIVYAGGKETARAVGTAREKKIKALLDTAY
jgi:thiol-disulfide isomerase/thioredoxin